MIDIKNVALITENEENVDATFFTPKVTAQEKVKAVVVIAPAMGVDKVFYQDFSLWLANRGYVVITFDYSSMGSSNAVSYKKSKATITDWAMFDCKEILKQAASQADGKPIYWIGHSLGGQITAMIPNISLVTKIVTIASGSGYWRKNATALKKRVWFLWYFVAPILLKSLGYFPGKRLGMVGNLPFGVMSQWRKWCLHPQYLLGVENHAIKECYQKFNKPITSLSFSDDELMSIENINSLHSFFGDSATKMHRLSPEDVNAKRIGHFGFFKKTFQDSLWQLHLLPELDITNNYLTEKISE